MRLSGNRLLARIPKRAQELAWQAFTDWCLSKGLNPVPAHHWTLAAYALALEDQEKPEDIRKILQAVAKAHLEKSRARPDRHPLIERTLKMIATRKETREQKSELFDDDLVKTGKPKKGRKPKKVEDNKKTPKPKAPLIMSGTPKLVSRRRLSK
jgi:hypothetical protein